MTTLPFSDTTDFQGIVQGIDFECGGTDRDDYSLADITRNVNFGLDYINMYLTERGGSVKASEPVIETFNVTSGTTNEVTITSAFMEVIEVSIDDDGGVVTKPDLFNPELLDETLEEIQEDLGTPERYVQEGPVIKFDRTFDFTKTGAVSVKIRPLPTFFDDGDTTETSGLPRTSSEAVVLYGAFKWCDIFQKERSANLMTRLNEILERVVAVQRRLNAKQVSQLTARRENNR